MFTETLYEQIKPKSISYSHCHTCDTCFYIGESGLYELFSLALANTYIQYKQINYDADNIDNNK